MWVDLELGESSLTIYPTLRKPTSKMRAGERTIPYASIVSIEFKDAASWDSFRSLRGLTNAITTLGPGWIRLRLRDGSEEKIMFGGGRSKDYRAFVEAHKTLLAKIGTEPDSI